jgi:hypothetical protein
MDKAMARKNKRNIKALIAKRQQLQSLENRNPVSIPGAPKLGTAAVVPPVLANEPARNNKALPAYKPGREIWRTVISTGIVTLILIAVIVADSRVSFLEAAGDALYRFFRLNS